VLANAKTCHKSGGTRRSMSVKGKRRHTQDSSKLKVSCGIYIQQLLFFFSLLSHLFLFFLLFRVPPIYALSIEALLQLSLSERCVHAYEACTPPKSISTKRRWEYNQGRVSGIFQPVFWYLYIGNML
jgi:hypothetical protein